MTRLTPLWSQSGSYPAGTDRQLIRAIWPRGGVVGMTPAVVPETMQIQLDAGSVVIPASDLALGAWLCAADAPERVAIGTAPPSGQDRIDRVVVAVDDATPSWVPQVVPGNPGSNPAPPAAPAGTSSLCSIRVRGGSAVLQPDDLADLRSVAGQSVLTFYGFDPVQTPVGAAGWVRGSPFVLVPVPGVYAISFSAVALAPPGGGLVSLAYNTATGVTDASSGVDMTIPDGAIATLSRSPFVTTVADAGHLALAYASQPVGGQFVRRTLTVTPVQSSLSATGLPG